MAQPQIDVRDGLMAEHRKLLLRIRRWRTASLNYRWGNVVLFMMCKLIVPTGALIVAMDMISILMKRPLLSSEIAAGIAIVVTFFASLEAMLNPGSKKRLAFNLNNELCALEHKVALASIEGTDQELSAALTAANAELRKLLNHYADNGY
jgi:hypothetical protein